MITFPSSSCRAGSGYNLQSVGQMHSSETHSGLNYGERVGKDICFAGTERGRVGLILGQAGGQHPDCHKI